MAKPDPKRLQKQIEQAALRKARRTGQAPSEEELRGLKVQTLPASRRGWFAVWTFVFGVSAWWLGQKDYFWLALLFSVIALACLFFAVIGVRRTVDSALEQFGEATVEVILRAAARAVMRLLD